MTKPVVIDEKRPFDPLVEDLAAYLTRLRSMSVGKRAETADREGMSEGVLTILKKLEEIYSPRSS